MKFVIIILIIFVLRKLVKPMAKGEVGEREVNKKLESLKGYIVLKDILLKTDNGTTQIDHILVGPKGVFVIETKNFGGTIYGDQWEQYWTQIFYAKKNKFYNPIRQNYAHVKAVQHHMKKFDRDMIHSLIVFGDSCNIKKIKVDTPVIQTKNIKKFIRKYKTDYKLSQDDIKLICDKLNKANIQTRRARKQHIKNIKKRAFTFESAIEF
ncbi:MAG: nuclease-related domain-containing protein [Clostridium sp.]